MTSKALETRNRRTRVEQALKLGFPVTTIAGWEKLSTHHVYMLRVDMQRREEADAWWGDSWEPFWASIRGVARSVSSESPGISPL